MRLEFEISNNPRHTGVKRKIVLESNTIEYKFDFSKMVMKIHYYEDVAGAYGDSLDTVKGFEPTPYDLTASTIKVDPITGTPVEKIFYDGDDNVLPSSEGAVRFEWPTHITDWEYFQGIKPSAVGMTADNSMIEILTAIYAFVINRRDAAGGFNA